MRRLPLAAIVPLLVAPLALPAHAGSVVTHGWGFSSEPEEGIYTSRGFCDAAATGGVAVETTAECYFANPVSGPPRRVMATTTTPGGVATATLETETLDRGLWCWRGEARFADNSVAYYPGPTRNQYECALL